MKVLHFFPLAIALLFFSCNTDSNIDAKTTTVNLAFNHTVDGVPVELDKVIYTNNFGEEFSIKTIKYFVSDISLLKADNSVIRFPDIHYVDIHTAETLLYTFNDKIPEGEYAGISFVLGIVQEKNITGSLGLDLDRLMEWPVPMGGGYHYMKLEGEYVTPDETSFFNFHSGMLDGVPYEVHVSMNQPFTVKGDNLNLDFSMEIQNWFKNPVDWSFVYFGSAIMGNKEAQETIQKNGADVFSFSVANSNE